jgi:hypothetical protein
MRLSFDRRNCWKQFHVPWDYTFDGMLEVMLDKFDFDFDHLYKASLVDPRVSTIRGPASLVTVWNDEVFIKKSTF